MTDRRYLAVDLGAESGRVLAAGFDGRTIALDELHRFANTPVRAAGAVHWDVLRLWHEIQAGLRVAGDRYQGRIASIGVDTWGVDFALLGRGDVLLGNPVHYRDQRTDGMMEVAFERISRDDVFAQTGIQFMQLNTLYQLLAMRRAGSPILEAATTFLTIPDFFHWLLQGAKLAEFSNATTTQCYDPRAGDWARPLLETLGIPTVMFPAVIPPGTRLGMLRPAVAQEVGLRGVEVVAPATHDTGSAVAAVPAQSTGQVDWCYLSSGTWSLVGVEIPQPLIDSRTLAYNFTNEGGVNGTYRLLKNVMGLWLVQQCRRAWQRAGNDLSYEALTERARTAAPFVSLVDPDHASFLSPDDMPGAIAEYCRRTGQPAPADEGAFIRCCLASLALKYRWVIERLEELVGNRLNVIHIVGGGTNNTLLCQMTADACHRPVLAGPVEATALGNALMQAVAMGDLGGVGDMREVVRRSFELTTYEPAGARDQWHEAYERFRRLLTA